MTNSSADLWNIPQIGSTEISAPKTPNKPDVPMFDNAPNDISLGDFFLKVLFGLLAWICVAALLFASFALTGWSNLWNIVVPIVWFVVSLIWNLALAGLYNLVLGKRYYDFWKMFGLIFVSSLILFVCFFIISIMNIWELVLWLQILFALYISSNLIDFLSQPNYSASSLMWNTVWCTIALLIFLWISTLLGNNEIFIIVSPIITYTALCFWSALWDAIYYKFYERWNNPFYLPSLNELREERRKEEIKKQKDEEDVNVEVK